MFFIVCPRLSSAIRPNAMGLSGSDPDSRISSCDTEVRLYVLTTFCLFLFSLQHFVCARCEKPFLGHKHYERNGKAYCEIHYNLVKQLLRLLTKTHSFVNILSTIGSIAHLQQSVLDICHICIILENRNNIYLQI